MVPWREQTFGGAWADDEPARFWNIGKIHDWAVENLPVTKVPLSDLAHIVKPGGGTKAAEPFDSPEFAKRARATKPFPIMLSLYKRRYDVIDGSHRIWKALDSGQATIDAYVIPYESLPDEALTTEERRASRVVQLLEDLRSLVEGNQGKKIFNGVIGYRGMVIIQRLTVGTYDAFRIEFPASPQDDDPQASEIKPILALSPKPKSTGFDTQRGAKNAIDAFYAKYPEREKAYTAALELDLKETPDFWKSDEWRGARR